MAKGLRSSRNKMNNSKLRSRVFGPIEDARKERLSAKLVELASKPKSRQKEDIGMEREEKDPKQSKQEAPESRDTDPAAESMDVDQITEPNSASRPTTRNTKRVEKRGRVKAKASMVFPVYKKGRRIGPRLTARQKKQSLKP